MKGLESGKDKLKKICEVLRKETLEPAEQEKQQMLAAARDTADEIVSEAKNAAKKMIEEARLEIEKQKKVFQASLSHASRQAVETLKESIEQKLFNPALADLILKPLQDPSLIAKLITAMIEAIRKEGTESDISAVIAATLSARSVNELLANEVISQLKEKSVIVGTLAGGIQINLEKDHITLDLSDEMIRELIGDYIRKDFREFIFGGV